MSKNNAGNRRYTVQTQTTIKRLYNVQADNSEEARKKVDLLLEADREQDRINSVDPETQYGSTRYTTDLTQETPYGVL